MINATWCPSTLQSSHSKFSPFIFQYLLRKALENCRQFQVVESFCKACPNDIFSSFTTQMMMKPLSSHRCTQSFRQLALDGLRILMITTTLFTQLASLNQALPCLSESSFRKDRTQHSTALRACCVRFGQPCSGKRIKCAILLNAIRTGCLSRQSALPMPLSAAEPLSLNSNYTRNLLTDVEKPNWVANFY